MHLIIFHAIYLLGIVQGQTWPFYGLNKEEYSNIKGDASDEEKVKIATKMLQDLLILAENRTGLYEGSEHRFSFFFKIGGDNELSKFKNVKQFDKGFIIFAQMPATDDDYCDMEKVLWNDPLVRIQIENNFGMLEDSVKVYEDHLKNLWDILTFEEKMNIDPNFSKMVDYIVRNWKMLFEEKQFEELLKEQRGFFDFLEGEIKEFSETIQAFFSNEKKRVKYYNKPIVEYNFDKIIAFFKPDTRSRMGVCKNFLGFSKQLSQLDPTADTSKYERGFVNLWSKERCIVIHSEIGSGRSMICHSQSSELASGIYDFLVDTVKKMAKNCEFLSRHLRNQREELRRFIAKTKKSGIFKGEKKEDDDDTIELKNLFKR